MPTEQVIECTSACTVTVVHTFNIPLLNLDVQQGLILSAAGLSVWALAWGWNALTRPFRDSGDD